MKKCGETPELVEEMWLDERSMITTMSFAKPAERHRTQHHNWNGASFQAHTEVGTMKFKQSDKSLHCHEFSPEFITGLQNKETQPLGTAEENTADQTNQQHKKQKKHESHVTSLGHQR